MRRSSGSKGRSRWEALCAKTGTIEKHEAPVANRGGGLFSSGSRGPSPPSDVAGDGTTTATVLAQAIYAEGIKNVTVGANPMDLKRGIDHAVEVVVKQLKKYILWRRSARTA